MRIKYFIVILFVLFSFIISFPLSAAEVKNPIAIVIHGGAGYMNVTKMSSEKIVAYKSKLREALQTGYDILKKGGTSLDAVEATIIILEDSPLFNAGKGAVFTNEGKNELDSSIMDGRTRNAGAVAGVKKIKNPISLARLVMEKSKHVLLSGKGAEIFAGKNKMKLVPESYFYTKKRMESLLRLKKKEQLKNIDKKMGTVGCVALDSFGNLAAGTSTGGMTNKRFGRIGDSPIIGAGTFADNGTCAISSTGHGEFFIRWVVAYDISALMKYKNMSLEKAANLVVKKKLVKAGGNGGIIGVDKEGNVITVFNTSGMYRGWVDKKGNFTIKIFKD